MVEIRPSDAPECMTPKTGDHVLVIFNNDVTPVGVVVHALMVATGCDVNEAVEEMSEAHHEGSAVVHMAAEQECLAAAGVIERAGVRTLVRPD